MTNTETYYYIEVRDVTNPDSEWSRYEGRTYDSLDLAKRQVADRKEMFRIYDFAARIVKAAITTEVIA